MYLLFHFHHIACRREVKTKQNKYSYKLHLNRTRLSRRMTCEEIRVNTELRDHNHHTQNSQGCWLAGSSAGASLAGHLLRKVSKMF